VVRRIRHHGHTCVALYGDLATALQIARPLSVSGGWVGGEYVVGQR
jgi:hypothetical protein